MSVDKPSVAVTSERHDVGVKWDDCADVCCLHGDIMSQCLGAERSEVTSQSQDLVSGQRAAESWAEVNMDQMIWWWNYDDDELLQK